VICFIIPIFKISCFCFILPMFKSLMFFVLLSRYLQVSCFLVFIHDIYSWYLVFWAIFENVMKIQVSLKSDKNNWYFIWRPIHILNQISISSYNNNNNNYYYYLPQLGCHLVAGVILHVHKTWNWLLLNLSLEDYMRGM
jgi:hypothetical protein